MMTDATKPKSGHDLETKAMDVDVDDAAIESGSQERLTRKVTNAVDNSGFAVWCKDNGLSDQAVQTLLDAGFRSPKDLMDREDDLDDLIDANKLKARDYKLILASIERVRNASASISVGNAALGLTREESAARGNAAADAERAAELDDQIKQAFARYREQNTLEWQKKNLAVGQLLRSAVPRKAQTNNFNFIASSLDSYVGKAYTELLKAVSLNFDGDDDHDGLMTAIVQAFGCGKTRAALQLSKDCVLLPMRMSSSHKLVQTLINAQMKLYTELMNSNGWKPTIEAVRVFSESCLRLVHLALFALLALHKHCIDLNLVRSENALQRHDLAVLLRLRTMPLVDWTVEYFERHQDEILRMPETEFSKLVEEAAHYGNVTKVIFLFDEAHGILSSCRGYCLHKEKVPPLSESDVLRNWSAELSRKDGSVTNLLYQFRRVSNEYFAIEDNCNGFVMCSTVFSIWNAILDEPSTRGETVSFCGLHWFTVADIQQAIQHYFNVPGEIFTEERIQKLSKLRRPSFVARLMKELAVGSITDGVEPWFVASLAKAMTYAKDLMRKHVERLTERANELLATGQASCHLVYLVYAMDKLCGGKLDLKHATEQEFVELVDHGVVRLVEADSHELICDDAAFIEAVDAKIGVLRSEQQAKESGSKRTPDVIGDPVMDVLLSPLIINLSGDKTLKGKVGERIIAWLALRDGLRLAGTETFYPRMGNECRAGTSEQLLQKRSLQLNSEPDLIWHVMTDPSFPWILFPSDQCGPDILFRQLNGGDRIVVIQCKMEKKIISLKDFSEALLTLNPYCFFKSPRNANAEAQKSKNRVSWLTHAGQLTNFSFQRIVFEPLGFSLEVQYLVSEYNAAQKKHCSSKFIHLLTLDDIKAQVSELNYDRILNVVKEKVEVKERAEMTLQSAWKARDKSQDHKLTIVELKKLCEARDIKFTWTPEEIKKKSKQSEKKPYEAKSETELIEFLDEYTKNETLEEKLADLKWDLP